MTSAYVVKTPKFKYILKIREIVYPIHKLNYLVGEERGPCLEASVYMPDIDERFQYLISEAHLYRIDALKECMIDSHEDTHASFGTELFYSFLNILKVNHPYVTTVSLQDSSYLPCSRDDTYILDLLTYSIACYGKTWYELKANAYLESEKDQTRYNQEISKYMTSVPKDTLQFERFLDKMRKNDFTIEKVYPHLSQLQTVYETAASFPEVFQYLNTLVTKTDKCKFYKVWLEQFIGSFITIKRDWKINITENAILGNVLNISTKRQMSQRTQRKTPGVGKALPCATPVLNI